MPRNRVERGGASVSPACQPEQVGAEHLLTNDPAVAAVADIASGKPLIELAPADSEAVARLRDELGVADAVAQVLVRRGHDTAAVARQFVAGDEPLDEGLLPGARMAVERLRHHLDAGTPIAVHGDYDADGVCSTVVTVDALTQLGAQVTWHVPDRFVDGYGLGERALRRFAEAGVGLVIAVDCGVTALTEAALARHLGMELIVLDHHEPGPELPEATIVHPALGDYDNASLCATAVAWKTMRLLYAQLGADGARLEHDVALAGLATVTDVMPLLGENRWLVRRGIEAMRTTPRVGLRELMRAAAVDPLAIDATTLGFRLGPRINAAGRMRTAEAAVELLLTTSAQRAAQLADELHGLNAARQQVEQEVLWQAEQQAADQLDGYALVVAGEDWHKGVLGIVAGRLAQRHRRPCVALSLSRDVAEGSARGGNVYDLIAGLRACDEHLTSYGGHRAAAGLALEASRLDAFRAALREDAAARLSPADLRPRFVADAVVGVPSLTLDTAEQLAKLGPFGNGNPEPVLVVPDVTVEAGERMGATSQHARLSLRSRDGRARAVAFDWRSLRPPGDGPWRAHAVTRLRPNQWNGVVEAQVQVQAVVPFAAQDPPATQVGGWRDLFALELAAPLVDVARLVAPAEPPEGEVDRRGSTPLAPIVELASAGVDVLLAARDPGEWRDIDAALAALGVDASRVDRVAIDSLAGCPAGVAVVLADPPLHGRELQALSGHEGLVVAAWGRVDHDRERAAIDAAYCSREYVAAFWRLFDAADELAVELLPQAAADAGITWLDAATAARMARILSEVGLVQLIPAGPAAETIKVRRDLRVELDRSEAFRSYSEIRKHATQCLSQLTSTS